MFHSHFRPPDVNPFYLSVSVNFQGLKETANYLGRASLLADEQKALKWLSEDATLGLWERWFHPDRATARARACLRMLKVLWGALQAIAADPVLTDTGQYTPRRQQRTFADQLGQIQNELTNLQNFEAKVKMVSGEYTIRTFPPSKGVPERQLKERLARIKRQMRFLGITRKVSEIAEETRKRHEQLRGSAGADDPPPTHF